LRAACRGSYKHPCEESLQENGSSLARSRQGAAVARRRYQAARASRLIHSDSAAHVREPPACKCGAIYGGRRPRASWTASSAVCGETMETLNTALVSAVDRFSVPFGPR
jgi:hypothetical protein